MCLSSFEGGELSVEIVGELSVEIVGDLLCGGYMRAVKCDCLVLSLWRRFTEFKVSFDS